MIFIEYKKNSKSNKIVLSTEEARELYNDLQSAVDDCEDCNKMQIVSISCARNNKKIELIVTDR